MDQFAKCAKLFKVQGQPMHELCDHNYKVCTGVLLIKASEMSSL